MNRSKRVAVLLVGVFLAWVGLCQIGVRVPCAGERQVPVTGSPVVRETRPTPPVGSADVRSEVGQSMAILSMVPVGQSVRKGDLLVEFDDSALVDRRIQQVRDVKKAESEMIVATESQNRETHAAAGQVALAEKALRLTQARLKAFLDGEYPQQLALGEGTAALADQKRRMLQERMMRLRAAADTQKDEAAITALQEAEIALREAEVQSVLARGSLAMLKGLGRDNKVAELELAVAQKESDLVRARDAVSAAAACGAATLSLAKMNYEMEAERLAKLDDQIGKCRIYAPQDGTVAHPDDAAVVRGRQALLRLLPATPPK